MIKLTAHSLTRAGWFRPETMGLNVEERMSSATLTLPLGTENLAVGDWLQDDCDPGAGIVWRVKTIDRQYDKITQTVTLEHIINALKDIVMFGEVTPATITGTVGASTCTAAQAITYILSQCPDWTVGTIASAYSSVSNPYNFSSDTLFEALETVSSSLQDCLWEYDFTSYPFKLNVTQMDSDVDSEMRMSRNISTLRVTVDRSGMYTRFYPIGKNNLKITGGYVSLNESTWGVISKVETDQSKKTEAELTAWANERLSRHAEPLITVTVAGLELSKSTGESLDHFVIGRKCRLPLPEYGTTVTERVTKLAYKDKLNAPEVVTVTLANKLADVASILRQQAASGGRGGRIGAKEAEEDHAWFVDTTEKVEMVAEAVAGEATGGGPDWSRVAQLTVDGNGIDARVTVAEGDIVSQGSRITQTEGDVTTLVTKTGIGSLGANETLYGKISVHSDQIALVVEKKNGVDVVKRAAIVAAINENDQSTVTISADKVDLSAYVLASTLDANWIKTQIETAGLISVSTLQIANGSTPTGGTNWVNILSLTRKYRVVSAGNNEYKLQYTNLLSGATWVDCESGDQSVNFSRATTLTGAWGSGNDANLFTVTASPQGNTESVRMFQQVEGAANPNATVYAKMYHTNPSVAGNQVGTTITMTMEENVSGKYVEIYTGSGSSKVQKGKVSTSDTWTAGQTDAGVTYDTSTHKVSRALSSSTKEVLIEMYTGNSWTNGTRVIEARIGSNAINSTTIYAPQPTMTFSATDLGSSAAGNDNPVTVTAKHGTYSLGTAQQVIHMGTGSWSSGQLGVTARLNDSNGACIDRVYISAPNASLGSNTSTKPSSGSALKTVTVGTTGHHVYFTVTIGGSYKGYVDVAY